MASDRTAMMTAPQSSETMQRSRSGVAERLISILECFSMRRRELTLTDISRQTGLPVSTAKRMIDDLCRFRILERIDNNAYRIGVRLWQLGSLAPHARDIREAALPYMNDLSSATGENVQLLVLNGTEVVVLERISGLRAVPTHTDVGGKLPLHATGVGKVLLALSSPALLDRVVSQGLPRFTPYTIADESTLREALDQVRHTGLGYSYQEMSLGAISVAAPIIAGSDGTLRGALGLVTRPTIDLSRLAPALLTATKGIARSL